MDSRRWCSSISDRGGHTQAGIEVPDIESAIAELKARGVEFEEYDAPELTTVNGIATEPGGDKAALSRRARRTCSASRGSGDRPLTSALRDERAARDRTADTRIGSN